MGLTSCMFASDLHGRTDRYAKLLEAIETDRPGAVFLGGDLLPHRWAEAGERSGLLADRVVPELRRLRSAMGGSFPQIFLILGNDDERASEGFFQEGDQEGLWTYVHGCWGAFGNHPVFGYSYVPPTPFQLKDWERYDVSRFVDPGCSSPERGYRTTAVDPDEVRYATIAADLERLTAERPLANVIALFHSPPYGTPLDRAALDGKMIDHVPMDVHVGSIAIQRFIEGGQPLVSLHGHIHEAARLTGAWRCRIGRTHCLNAAHDGPELALIRFDLEDLESASRELL